MRHHDGMTTEYLEADDGLYELLSFYALPDDAWSIELTAMQTDGGILAHVLVPDEDIERPCQVLTLDAERIPAEVMRRFLVEVAETARHAGISFEQGRSSAPGT